MNNAFNKLKELIVEPCMEKEETYSVRSRKVATIAVSLIASNALFTGIPVVVINGLFDPTLGAFLIGAVMVQLTITASIVPYIYLRRTKKLPDWVPDVQVWSVLPTTLLFSLFVHQGSVTIACTVTILMGIVLRIRGWYLLLVYGVCLNVLHALINDYAEELPALHDAFYSTQYLSIRIMYMIGSNICPLLLFGLGLRMIIRESVERADQADAAIAMNLAVADKLRRYDTDGVAVILAANRGKVDEKLLEAFAGIQQNLEEYRPHLPDYVIAASTSTTDPDGDDDDEEGDDSQVSLVDSFSASYASKASRSRTSSLSRKMKNGGEGSTRNRKGTQGDMTTTAESTSTDSNKSRSGRPRQLSNSQLSGAGGDDVTAQRPHFSGRATTVFIRFVLPESGNVRRGAIGACMGVLNRCVDAASKHAKAHKGALQYMQGCGLMVSFNAASRVATHESKACAFALALKTSVDEMIGADLVMHATIVTTNVLSFFAGNSGQLMLTVLGGFMPVHTAMHHYLSQTVDKAASCVLLSDSVVPTIDMMYDHRLLGGVSRLNYPQQHNGSQLENSRSNVGSPTGRGSSHHTLPMLPEMKGSSLLVTESSNAMVRPNEIAGNGGRTPTTLSQLLAFKNGRDEDEWLYHATKRGEDDPITRSNNAVRAALDGDAVPVEFSTQCDTSDVVLMKCVKERLEVCDRDESPFEVRTMTPTVMW